MPTFHRWCRTLALHGALFALIALACPALAADEPDLIFKRSTVFKWLTPNDKLATYGLDDPEVELSQRKKFLGIITKETERLTRLINQVLDLAKIESGNAEWSERAIDMKDVISDTLGAMGQLFKEKNIEVTVHLPERVSPVTADLDRMIQVMLNLLSNAAKFCDAAQGRVEISLIERNGRLQVDVRDNGRGISVQHQTEIFSKFHQVGDKLTDKPHGSGLGLHISRQIIEHFGGRLWVESDVGRGACFSFTVPIGAGARALAA